MTLFLAIARGMTWAIFGLSWLFLIVHTILSRIERAPWWRSIAGWIITTAVGSLAIVFTFGVFRILDPKVILQPWYQWAYLISIGLVGATVVAKLVLRVWLFTHRPNP